MESNSSARTCGILRRPKRIARIAATFALVLCAGDGARAVDFKSLVMPGPVIEGHEKVEKECGRCHRSFDTDAQNGLCLDCHKKVAADLDSSRGLHGRTPAVSTGDCRDCHTEHEGRGANIVGLDRDAFDHGRTDFPLTGAHTATACGGCHPQNTAHRETSSRCGDCHEDASPHKKRLEGECGDCHESSTWTTGRFDHSETRFPIDGRHAKTPCGLCHPNQRYQGLPTACSSCHELDDVHRGRLGPECQDCHTTETWKGSQFEHGSKTGFALAGGHAGLRCEVCHKKDPVEVKLKADCVACHAQDDEHRGRNGPQCESCHSTSTWKKSTFVHDDRAGFALRGAHAALSCDRCHQGVAGKERLETRCAACHSDDDPHEGQEGADCGRCHDEKKWEDRVRFNHDLASFPLLGLHALVPCEECHRSRRFEDADTACAACHEPDDPHREKLGVDCARCHTPNSWRIWSFDHSEQTSFVLHGSHEGLDCQACHQVPAPSGIRISQRCHSCHDRDDAHSGTFGRRCELCHDESSWKTIEDHR